MGFTSALSTTSPENIKVKLEWEKEKTGNNNGKCRNTKAIYAFVGKGEEKGKETQKEEDEKSFFLCPTPKPEPRGLMKEDGCRAKKGMVNSFSFISLKVKGLKTTSFANAVAMQ